MFWKCLPHLATILGILCFLSTSAQPTYRSATRPAFEQNIYQFFETLSNLETKAQKEQILTSLHPDAHWSVTVIGVSDAMQTVDMDFNEISKYLDYQLKDAALKTTRTIKKVHELKTRDRVGMASVQTSFEVHDGEGVMRKGTQINSIVQKRFKGEWKLARISTVEWVDHRYRGVCYCELFQGQASEDYIAKLNIPKGSRYASELSMFSIKAHKDGRLIRWKEQRVLWKHNGDILLRRSADAEPEPMGKASRLEDIIKKILITELFPENCSQIKVKRPQ